VALKSVLYGVDYIRHAAVVVEGPADAWRVGPGAVATFGVVVTPDQLARLARFPVRVVCFDSDPPGRARAAKLVSALAPFPGKTYDVVLDAEDPGSATPKEIKKLRALFLD